RGSCRRIYRYALIRSCSSSSSPLSSLSASACHALCQVCLAGEIRDRVHQEHDGEHHDRHTVGCLGRVAVLIGKGQIRQRGGGGGHDQDDQIQLLHDGNKDQHEAGNEAALGQ